MQKTLKDKIIQMENDIHYIKEALKKMPTIEGMKLANQELVEKIFRESEKRFASKAIEKIVWGTACIVSSAIIYAVVDLIAKRI